MTPYLRSESTNWSEFLTSDDAKAPLIGMVILGTALYQLYCKKNAFCSKKTIEDEKNQQPKYAKDDPRSMVQSMRDQAQKKGKYSPKMEKSLSELEGMFSSLSNLGDNITETFDDMGGAIGSGKTKKKR